jgi:hypothetical protein
MSNKKDKEAFEKWWKENMVNPDWLSSDHSTDVCKAWQAALEYERKRSQILVDALDFIEQNYETNNEGTVALYRYWKGEA